jgi:hypothetical protein
VSDRYNQLDLVDYLEAIAGRSGAPQTPITPSEIPNKAEMYPNFSVGDVVEIDRTHYRFRGFLPSYLQGEFTIQLILQGNKQVVLTRPDNSVISMHLDCLIKKVRVHSEDENEHKSPSIHYEIKIIKGRKYKYARWWEGDRHKSKYIGRA